MTRLAAAVLGACLLAPATPATKLRPVVAFLTDFSLRTESVATCKGVMLRIAPELTIVDITHDVPPFDIRTGAVLLERSVRYYPEGAVLLAVVDPGVGTARRAIAGRTRAGHFLVGPDNGLLSFALELEGVAEVRQITNRSLFNTLDPLSSIFHGRDVFAPVAAHLASGARFDTVGPAVSDWVRLDRARAEKAEGLLRGEATLVDAVYGNVTTNLPAAWATDLGWTFGDRVSVSVGERRVEARYVRTFGEAALGQPLVCPEDQGFLALALREGDFATTHSVRAGTRITIERAPRLP